MAVRPRPVDVLDVDHVGVNVPEMDQAVRFFSEVLGCTPVTEIGPMALGAAWKKRYRIHQSAGVKRIVMLRAGDGANIELFQFDAPDAAKEQPFGDDAGATHLAFYAADLTASVAALQARGVRVLNDPIVSKDGPTSGESWVYFLTPWGSQIELGSYPRGKGYERNNPAVRLWSPKDLEAQPPADDAATIQGVVDGWGSHGQALQRGDLGGLARYPTCYSRRGVRRKSSRRY